MAPSISAEIDIAAPPNKVWAVLTDYDPYPEWNPLIVKMSGDRKVDGRFTVTINPPNNSSGMTFGIAIQTFLPNEHLHWRGRLLNVPWLLTGRHHLVLRPTDAGTRFEQSEHFSGILALLLYWIGSDVFENGQKGFRLMNIALKERVEGRSTPNSALKQRVQSSVKANG